ncbi:replication endonuclease [Vibrio algarum]|uniref:Replication endonuclease n=1 Tax=Vibrio algarum TaxID=3020714 RepID=A0ABT4YMP9_9VIBR|nr:replication endonuclease [Vibrio sp. KJ40-1]MDB1122829.1 replication endonuclease [Vibrio sp. KJ40-1]
MKRKVESRKSRTNPTKENLERAARDGVNFGLKHAAFIEDKFPFVDYRKKAKPCRLTHDILMSDTALSTLAEVVSDEHSKTIASFDAVPFVSYVEALTELYNEISVTLKDIFINPPSVTFKGKDEEELERSLEIALLKLQDELWIEKRLTHLRAQYIEYAQITLLRVGEKAHQTCYVSPLSFTNWKRKQREGLQFIEAMVVLNNDTGEHFELAEVVKRTTANPENRRIEMMVRSRGFEELAQDLGYTALFITWTLPSKYHRNSAKWNGASVKEGHQALMNKWANARAMIAKDDIEYFGFRVAEPHKDATSHGHYFLFCSHAEKNTLIEILKTCAISEDRDELGHDISKRFDVKECDPSKGGATAYIAKYISKNINGNHMPETEAEEYAYRVRAWASTHRIRQFQQFGGEPVSLWRNLRKANPSDTLPISEELEELRQATDSSKWSLFCKLATKAKIEYQEKQNKYGETVRKVIGFSWLGQIIETAATQYSLVRRKDLQRALESRSGSPWSTENNCNQTPEKPILPLEKALMDVTGWSVKGVQCLIPPLMRGSRVSIDRYTNISFTNNRLLVN